MNTFRTAIFAFGTIALLASPAFAGGKASGKAVSASVGAGCVACSANGGNDLAGGAGISASKSKASAHHGGSAGATAGGDYGATGNIDRNGHTGYVKNVSGSANGGTDTSANASD